jgi:hypothetical protein
MKNVGSYSVRSAWRSMAETGLVPTVEESAPSTLRTTEVSEPFIALLKFYTFNAGKREIEALPVYCSNVERGCEWVGTIGTLEEHVATCGFTLVPCPEQCSDNSNEVKHFLRKLLDQHLALDCPNRYHECVHCGKKSTFTFITQTHDQKCRKKPIHCPTGCGNSMERQQVKRHIRIKCPYTMTPCKYKGIGCNTELMRKDMAAHEQDDKLHLHMALETVNIQQNAFWKALNSQQGVISKLQDTTKSQQDTIDSLQATVGLLRPKIFVLSGYLKKKQAGKAFRFPPFYTHVNGYRMALEVDANGWGRGACTHVSVCAPMLSGEHVKWPFIGKLSFTLLNQLEDKNHHTMTMPLTAADNTRVGSSWGFTEFILHSALTLDLIKNTQYLKDDCLYFRVSVKVDDHKPWLVN